MKCDSTSSVGENVTFDSNSSDYLYLNEGLDLAEGTQREDLHSEPSDSSAVACLNEGLDI